MYVGQPVPNEWSRPNTTNSGANDDMNNAPSDAVVGIWPRLLGCDVRGDRRKRTILRTFGGARSDDGDLSPGLRIAGWRHTLFSGAGTGAGLRSGGLCRVTS